MSKSEGRKAYKDKHWGYGPVVEVEIDDPTLPSRLVEWGRLVEIHFRPINNNPKRKDKIIRLNRTESNNSHLAYDLDHPHQRLYAVLDSKVEKRMKKAHWDKSDYARMGLSKASHHVGGRHAADDYPSLKVRPVGTVTAVVYATLKGGDEPLSFYIHKMGEENGLQPALCVDKKGRLWFAGGDYYGPDGGITN